MVGGWTTQARLVCTTWHLYRGDIDPLAPLSLPHTHTHAYTQAHTHAHIPTYSHRGGAAYCCATAAVALAPAPAPAAGTVGCFRCRRRAAAPFHVDSAAAAGDVRSATVAMGDGRLPGDGVPQAGLADVAAATAAGDGAASRGATPALAERTSGDAQAEPADRSSGDGQPSAGDSGGKCCCVLDGGWGAAAARGVWTLEPAGAAGVATPAVGVGVGVGVTALLLRRRAGRGEAVATQARERVT